MQDDHLVQISATRAEIDRRIGAFSAYKRKEIDDTNVRFYFSVTGRKAANETTCARTQTIFRKRISTRIQSSDDSDSDDDDDDKKKQGVQTNSSSSRDKDDDHFHCGVEERLSNMEIHLGISRSDDGGRDVYQRLQKLEERILFLEGMSPEYFQETLNPATQHNEKASSPEFHAVAHTFSHPVSAVHHAKRHKMKRQETNETLSVEEMDQKIATLQQKLIDKQKI
ncbi:MAP3K12-binding inhibitory protein 1-like isoform X2 [Oscarella lobularis]|uniref:MAP3K12-binding inhibitory protein 1-like isoform X2 n=1 Tax=Oscarella lobularis TaxID=121494 RepID=UPI003313BB12